MAIGRVAGPLLYSDLDRQGVDLQFSTENKPLLYLDFANFRAAINANTLDTTATFTVNGETQLDQIKFNDSTISSDTNLTLHAAGDIRIGDVSQVKVTGGLPNYLLTTDGSGNLSWENLNTLAAELDLSANNIHLGITTDTSATDYSAYRYWNEHTTLADAVDNLNQVMLNVYNNTYVGQAEFTADIVAGPSPLTVAFTSTTVGNPTEYFWEFGDGFTSTLKNPVHTYGNAAGGQYSVYFKASNPAGTRSAAGRLGDGTLAQGSYADSLKTNFITLYTPLPVAAFSLDRTEIDNTNTVYLTNLSSYGTSYTVYWGDGTSTPIPSDLVPGGVGAEPVSHTYTNTGGDFLYSVTLATFSATAGPGGATTVSDPTAVRVYNTHNPIFIANKSSGNNQHNTVPNGLVVGFTNTTGTAPGDTFTFPGNIIKWNWGDGTTTDVNIGSSNPGDLGQVISHAFELADPKVEQTFNVTLEIINGHSSSSFISAPWAVTVFPAPTALFYSQFTTTSDRIGDTPQTGYLFTDLQGRIRSDTIYFNNSINADTFTWSFGDGRTAGPLLASAAGGSDGPPIFNTYSATGSYTLSLLAHGESSISLTDDTRVESNYLTVLPPPPPPDGLGSKTISLTSVGTTPLLAAAATNNTTPSTMPGPGTAVTRVTTVNPIETSTASNAYNASTGDIRAVINGVPEEVVPLTGGDETGTYGSLVIEADLDAHIMDPTVYPSAFYSVVSAKISKGNGTVPVGFNSYQISHSTTGSTNALKFVKDDVTLPPTLDGTSAIATTATLGTPKYISGIPYFNTGGVIAVEGVKVYDWIGQTYINSTSPLSVNPGPTLSGSGSVITPQGKTYANIDNTAGSFLAAGIPIANTGKNISNQYTLGSIPVTVNGLVAATGQLAMSLENVNGTSSVITIPTLINVYAIPVAGLDETSIPVSSTLGGTYTDNGKRIFISGASGAHPTLSPTTDYFNTAAFTGPVSIADTDEAVIRFGTLRNDITDYSTYLPQGPDCSGRSGEQYFRFAFRRTTLANFTVTFSGKISGMMIAAPGTQIDSTSTLDGWLDATSVYAGAGIPGAWTATGGNGSNGCAKTAGDKVPVGQLVTNKSCTLTLGSENASNAYKNEIIVSIALNAGDSITAISIS